PLAFQPDGDAAAEGGDEAKKKVEGHDGPCRRLSVVAPAGRSSRRVVLRARAKAYHACVA
ncbi:MAG: hypothetical protein ACRYHA_17220, partial [Janthinobacterium lividum]